MAKQKSKIRSDLQALVSDLREWASNNRSHFQAIAIVLAVVILGFFYWQYSQSTQQVNATKSQAQLALTQAQALESQIANATKTYQQAAADEASAKSSLTEMQTLLNKTLNNPNVTNQTKQVITQLLKPPAVAMTLPAGFNFSGFKAVGISQSLLTNFNVIIVNTGYRPVILGSVVNSLACNYNVSGKIKANTYAVGQVDFYPGTSSTASNPDYLPLNGTLKVVIPVVIAPKQITATSNQCWLNLTASDTNNNELGSLILQTKVLSNH